MTRTRLALVTDSDSFGGAEVYLLHLVRHLPDEFAVTLLASTASPAQLLDGAAAAGVPVIRVEPVRSKRDVGRIVALARALATARADLVHLNLNTPANNRHAIAVATAQRRRTVATLHLTAPVDSSLHRTVLRALFGRLDRAIAVSRETRAQLCDELGMRPERVEVVANGVETRDAVVLRADATPLRIGGLGRMTPQKGFDVLVRAVRTLCARGIAVEAVIAGDGPDRAALQALAGDAPVSLLPFVDDVDAFLRSLDVFCLPSRWEGLPFALLEAMMRGLPCIATTTGDVPDALRDAGVLIPADDVDALAGAIAALAQAPSHRVELGAAAHTRAIARYSVHHMVEQTVAVYAAALRR